MIRSELILPIRWYNDLFNQERFGIDHKPLCEKLLVYKPETLPSFQVKTPSSMLSPSSFRMRNVCVDAEQNYYNRWTEKAANLQEPDALAAFGPYPTQDYIGSPTPITIFQNVCNVFKSVKLDPADYTQNGQPTSMLLPVVNCQQRFTITFDAFKSPSNLFNVAIYNGAILVGVINKPGTYTFDFKTTFNPITILFANFDATEDYFEISYIQSQVLDIFCQTNDIRDIDLDEYLPNLTLFDLANGESVYVFCKPDNNIPIPPGDYYYYLKFADDRSGIGEYYYSEVFTIKSNEDIRNYYCLSWTNSCDFAGKVIYFRDSLPCQFINSVYLPASYFRPEYPTVSEVEEDGAGNQVPVFQKWQKTKTLEVISPEFLTDALSAIFMHDEVTLLEPKNKKENLQSIKYVIKKIEQEITDVYEDSHQRVLLTLLIDNNIQDMNCCVVSEPFGPGYHFTADNECEVSEHKLIISNPPVFGDGLRKCIDDALVSLKRSDVIKNLDDGKFYRLKLEDNIYQVYRIMPVITTVEELVDPSNGIESYKISGIILPNTFVYPEYKKDGGAWTDTFVTAKGDSEGDVSVYIPKELSNGATDFLVRLKNLSKEEVYGYTNEYEIIHSIVMPDPLRAYNFDSNLVDDSSAEDGTAVGTDSYLPGKVGQAISFGGLTMVNIPPYQCYNDDYTIAMWVYPTGNLSSDLQPLLSYYYSDDGVVNKYAIISYNEVLKRIEFTDDNVYGLGIVGATDNNSVLLNTWTRVILKVTAGVNAQFYINGIPMGVAFVIPQGSHNTEYFRFADNTTWGTANKYKGRLDIGYIWDSALSDDEITADFNIGNGLSFPY